MTPQQAFSSNPPTLGRSVRSCEERVYPLPYPSPTDPLPAGRPKVSYPGAENLDLEGGLGYETFRRLSFISAPGYETFWAGVEGRVGAKSPNARGGVLQGPWEIGGTRVRDFRSLEAPRGRSQPLRQQGTRVPAPQSPFPALGYETYGPPGSFSALGYETLGPPGPFSALGYETSGSPGLFSTVVCETCGPPGLFSALCARPSVRRAPKAPVRPSARKAPKAPVRP